MDPDEMKAQADRIRDFLKRLAKDDVLLLRYVKDRDAVLREEEKAGRLTTEDVALLREGSYSQVAEVMSKSEGEPQWWIVCWWVVGG
jgi:hypothetical protein